MMKHGKRFLIDVIVPGITWWILWALLAKITGIGI